MTEPDTSILNFGVDRYVLRGCRRHAAETVAICAPEPWDFGPWIPRDGVSVLRVDDHVSAENVLSALHRRGLRDHRFTAVHAADEWSLVTAGLVAQTLGTRGLDPDVAVHFRDKYLQKRKIRQAGIRTADATVIEDIHDVEHLAGADISRSVLKPIAGGGTAHTITIADFDDLARASLRFRAEGVAPRTFLLEEFVSGDEWAADGVVFDGELLFFALARYSEPCLTYVEQQHPPLVIRVDPKESSWAYDLAAPVVRRSLDALGLTNGIFHLELFHDGDAGEFSFGECAARIGGALTQEQVHYMFGVDLAEAGVLCSLGRRPQLDVRTRPGVVAATYIMGRPGNLVGHPSLAEVYAQDGVEFARFDVPFAATVNPEMANTGQNLGQLLVSADTAEEAEARIGELRNWFEERLVVARPDMTFREHRAWHEKNWPGHTIGGGVYDPSAARNTLHSDPYP